MKDKSVSRKSITLSFALLLGPLFALSLLVEATLAQEPQPNQINLEGIEGESYWLILDTARPVEEILPPLLKTLTALEDSGVIAEFEPTPQRSNPMAAAGVRVFVTRPAQIDLLRTLPGVLDAIITLPPPPPQHGNLDILANTGVITGRVTDAASGLPLKEVPVFVYDAESFASIGSGTTETGGEYTVEGVSTYGKVKVMFNSNNSMSYNDVYLSEWYKDQPFFSLAAPIDLPAGGVVAHIDAALERAGVIDGKVIHNEGGPASGVIVAIYKPNGYFVGKTTTTDTNGLFISRVPSGKYKLELWGGSEYLSEWYQDKDTQESADAIMVTTGATTTLTAQVTRTGAISGVITDVDTNAKLNNVEVTVYDAADKVVGLDLSDSQGEYQVTGLTSGRYRLRFRYNRLSYETEYYDNKTSLAAANPVTVTFGATTGSINAALTPATGRMTGTITKDGGAPLADDERIYIYFYDAIAGDWLGYFDFTADGTTEMYDTVVVSGTYKVYFSGSNLIGEWYDNQIDLAAANPVVIVNNATTSGINADLTVATPTGPSELGGCITGMSTTGGGDPLPGTHVRVYEAGYKGISYSIRMAPTNSKGTYSICNLTPGDYQVSFSRFPSATTWYDKKTLRATATTVTVTAGVTRTNINGSLDQLGGCIAGKITDVSGQTLLYPWFQVFEVGSNLVPIYEGLYGTYLYDGGRTDEDGGFVACGLPSGDYTVVMHGFNGEQGSVTAHVTVGQTTQVGLIKIGLNTYLPLVVNSPKKIAIP